MMVGEQRRIFKGALLSMAREGRMSLQVPNLAIVSMGQGQHMKVRAEDHDELDSLVDGKPTELVPAEWLVELKDNAPVVGKERGFLFLTRAGWEANKTAIREEFTRAPPRVGCTWAAFEEEAKKHFAAVEKGTVRKIKRLDDQLMQLRRAHI